MKYRFNKHESFAGIVRKVNSSGSVNIALLPLGYLPLDDCPAFLRLTFHHRQSVNKILDSGASQDGKVRRKQLSQPWACLQPCKICLLATVPVPRGWHWTMPSGHGALT